MMSNELQIVPVGPADDPVLVKHYLAIWDSYGTRLEDYAPDATEAVARFIGEARSDGSHGGFLAIVNGEIAGSAICCLLRSPYPEVIKPAVRRRGYIWSVYTEPRYRGKGVGKSLTERAIIHLKTAGCTDVVLHASDAGAPMYEKLGFTRAGEMRLAL
jgi:ribosomal protein S18 acetylase RimI-like enzyme